MEYKEVNRRVNEARLDPGKMNAFITDYENFIKSAVSQVKGTYVTKSDDLYSIGLLAFHEAIEGYNEEKGSFFPLAKKIIKFRVIDHLRKEKRRTVREISSLDQDLISIQEEAKNAAQDYFHRSEEEDRRWEVLLLKEKLKVYNIEFSHLIEASPKQKKLRDLYQQMAEYIVESPIVCNELTGSKKLPIKSLTEEFKVNRKKVERGRKYIIAMVLLHLGEYPKLRGYIGLR